MRIWQKHSERKKEKSKIAFLFLAGWILLLAILYIAVPAFLFRCRLDHVWPGQLAKHTKNPVIIVTGKEFRGSLYVNGYEVPKENLLIFQKDRAVFRVNEEWMDADTAEIWHADSIPFLARSNTLRVALTDENVPALELSDLYKKYYENGREARANVIAYLNELKESPYRIYLAVCDEGTGALDHELMDSLKELGVRTELIGKYRYSYVGVVERQKSLFEADAEDEIVLYEDEYASVASAGLDAGNFAFINVGGSEAAVGSRGLNIVVFDKEKNRIVESVAIDTCSDLTMTRFVRH